MVTILEWNVFIYNFNKKEIEVYNIFKHSRFLEDCKKAARKYKGNREAFEHEIKTSLMYYYWSKCEWEIILDSLFPRDGFKQRKVDVYEQVMLNWQSFIDYVWDHQVELRRRTETKKEE